ncbi:MAG: DUF4388 domain-containing protein [Chloroflexi bacterium]|nr:MAG: DUF4388 domain-containing protein [Chloroflexota bacterium]
MGFRGKLSDTNIMQVMNAINLAGQSGGLTVTKRTKSANGSNGKHGEVEQIRLGFQNGELRVACDDSRPMDLITILYNRNKITAAQADNLRSRRHQHPSDKGLALLLMNTYHVSREDIVESVRQYMIDIVNYVMTWRDGTFQFDEDDSILNEEIIPVSFRLDNLITNWRDVAKELNQLVRRVRNLDMMVELTPEYRARLKHISLSRQQWKVIATATKEPKTLRQIADENRFSAVEIRQAAVALEDAGLITLEPVKPKVKKGITGRLRETGLFKAVKPVH